MKKTKGFKYYAFIFGVSTTAIAIYAAFIVIRGDVEINAQSVLYLLTLPLMFTSLLFVFDKLISFLIPDKYKAGNDEMSEFNSFLNDVNKTVDSKTSFSIEEYRRLRDNPKFQKAISQIFNITKHGETADLSWDYLSKKFI